MSQAAFAPSIFTRIAARFFISRQAERPVGQCMATRIRIASQRIPQAARSAPTSAAMHIRIDEAAFQVEGLLYAGRDDDPRFALTRAARGDLRRARALLSASLGGSDEDKLIAAEIAGRILAEVLPARRA